MVRRSIDEILHDLLEITNELGATTDVDRTIELKLRRGELRHEAADVAGDPLEQLSDEALRGRILRCEQLLDEAERARLNPGAVGLGAQGREAAARESRRRPHGPAARHPG